jgi:hypothetical protein
MTLHQTYGWETPRSPGQTALTPDPEAFFGNLEQRASPGSCRTPKSRPEPRGCLLDSIRS